MVIFSTLILIFLHNRQENLFNLECGLSTSGITSINPIITFPINHFLECVWSGAQPAITIEDAIEALRLSLAMEASADQQE